MPKTTGGNMAPDEIRAILQEMNIQFEEKAIQDGTQFRCHGGEIVIVYKTGTLVCGGKITELSKRVEHYSQGVKAAGPGRT
jgi:hypothetical protein